MSKTKTFSGVSIVMLALPLLTAGCGDSSPSYNYPDRTMARRDGLNPGNNYPTSRSSETVFGGLNLFGGRSREDTAGGGGGGAGIGVNSFLWRASLDTVSFMPLASADPFGGVIITDWYQPPESPTERFKMTVYILDKTLRADGVRVSVFKQRQYEDKWIDAPVDAGTATDIENKILTRAREIRVAANPK